jgi:putative peptidoglycan binding protein
MKTTKLLLIALLISAMAGSSAFAAQRVNRTNARTSFTSGRTVANNWGHNRANNWGHHRHHRHHRSNVFFGLGFGYPYYGYGYGYPYGSYPYGYYTTYDRAYTDDATVAAVQRRLARAGYYHGAIDGVIGNGTRRAVAAYERNNGLPVDGRIDRQLLATMGLA